MRIYLASALFSVFERERNIKVATYLQDLGHEIFLPQEIADSDGNVPGPSEIFRECVAGLDDADLVVALVDGPDVDSGTAWELGYAFAIGRRIVSVRTDFRSAEQGVVNIMIQQCSTSLIVDNSFHATLHTTMEMLEQEVQRLSES